MEKVILKLDLRFGLVCNRDGYPKANEPKSTGSGKQRVCAGNQKQTICR